MDWLSHEALALTGEDRIGFMPFLLLAIVLGLVELGLRAAAVRGPLAPAPAAAERQVSIDGLRSFLALGVLVHHYAHTYNLQLHGR